MKVVQFSIPLSVLLFILSVLEVIFIRLFIKFIKDKRNRTARARLKNNQHHAEPSCTDLTSERVYLKTLAKINRSYAGKIIVSRSLYSEVYFFTEN